MTTQTFNLELMPYGVPPIVHVSQYDKGQTWLFNILFNNQLFSIPEGCSITVQGTKQDGTGFQYACTYSGSQVTVTEEQQMTIFAGDVTCELRITKESSIIGTLNFILRVEPAALRDDVIISDTELPLIEEAAEIAEHIGEYLEDAQQYAEDAEAWAVGTRGGTPIGNTDPAYQNNAKYYAEHFVGYVTDDQYLAIQSLFS